MYSMIVPQSLTGSWIGGTGGLAVNDGIVCLDCGSRKPPTARNCSRSGGQDQYPDAPAEI